jgi:selenocysteine lyase/cysteine desulfurase
MVEAIGDFDRMEWQPATTARRFECGSPNMLTIHALHASLSLLLDIGMERVEQRVLDNSRLLMDLLQSVPDLELITPTEDGRFAGIVTFRIHSCDNKVIFDALHSHGVFCAHRAGGIRWSPHFYTSEHQLEAAVELLIASLNHIKQ